MILFIRKIVQLKLEAEVTAVGGVMEYHWMWDGNVWVSFSESGLQTARSCDKNRGQN